MTAKLNVNIDHVATIREARKTIEPSVLEAARVCEQAGADGITVHIRGDRRHIQDRDIEQLREVVTTYLNVEMAATDEMVGIATRIKPDAVSLVPESPNEVTTEGGLNVIGNFDNVKNAIEKLKAVFRQHFHRPRHRTDHRRKKCRCSTDRTLHRRICRTLYRNAGCQPASSR